MFSIISRYWKFKYCLLSLFFSCMFIRNLYFKNFSTSIQSLALLNIYVGYFTFLSYIELSFCFEQIFQLLTSLRQRKAICAWENFYLNFNNFFSCFQAFVNHDIAFSVKPYFRGPFCIDDVREGLVVNFLKHLVKRCKV